jgi:catechol 2,3-dioxygenase-like lactoylglutathione lyase family enzyme
MRWRGVSQVEFAVSDYDDSVAFYDEMFGWLGYMSFWSLDIDYRSTYYMARFPATHSYIGIQPARSGSKLDHTNPTVGIDHIAVLARSRKEVDSFHREFLIPRQIRVTDQPKDYPQYTPGHYAVFFDDPINGIHWDVPRSECSVSASDVELVSGPTRHRIATARLAAHGSWAGLARPA